MSKPYGVCREGACELKAIHFSSFCARHDKELRDQKSNEPPEQRRWAKVGDPEGPCESCNSAQATTWWAGDHSSLEIARNPQIKQAWCEPCCLRAQIAHAEEQAHRLPVLRRQLEELGFPAVRIEGEES